MLVYFMNTITLIGFSIIFLYSLIQIFKFYGVEQEIYGVYLIFYIFIIVSIIVLPNNYPSI
jgi:hypothetical protein